MACLLTFGIPVTETLVRLFTNSHRCDSYAIFVVKSLYKWNIMVNVAPLSEVVRPLFNVLTVGTNVLVGLLNISCKKRAPIGPMAKPNGPADQSQESRMSDESREASKTFY